MILSVKPRFMDKILDRTMISTIRRWNPNWRKGKTFDFVSGGRHELVRYKFATGTCIGVLSARVNPHNKDAIMLSNGRGFSWVKGKELEDFIIAQGFDSPRDFWHWPYWRTEPFEGILIEWDQMMTPLPEKIRL